LKPIKLAQYATEILKQTELAVKEMLEKNTCSTKISLQIDISKILEKKAKAFVATIQFTPHAWIKMTSIVHETDSECAWHGVVERTGNLFKIVDILVYPQQATAATVESHDEKYGPWTQQLSDEVFFKLRMQGHSHVNFGVSPSVTDSRFYEKLLENIKDYYIFIIMNKKQKIWANIYDIENNIIFEDEDIIVETIMQEPIVDGVDSYQVWTDESIDEFIIKRTPVKATAKSTTDLNRPAEDNALSDVRSLYPIQPDDLDELWRARDFYNGVPDKKKNKKKASNKK
jgi:hypothetical protein